MRRFKGELNSDLNKIVRFQLVAWNHFRSAPGRECRYGPACDNAHHRGAARPQCTQILVDLLSSRSPSRRGALRRPGRCWLARRPALDRARCCRMRRASTRTGRQRQSRLSTWYSSLEFGNRRKMMRVAENSIPAGTKKHWHSSVAFSEQRRPNAAKIKSADLRFQRYKPE